MICRYSHLCCVYVIIRIWVFLSRVIVGLTYKVCCFYFSNVLKLDICVLNFIYRNIYIYTCMISFLAEWAKNRILNELVNFLIVVPNQDRAVRLWGSYLRESNTIGQLEMYDKGIWKGVCPLGSLNRVNVPLARVACRQKGMKGKSTN